jgi:hypothetical protein
MSNQSWRKYGGLNKMEKLNNITAAFATFELQFQV